MSTVESTGVHWFRFADAGHAAKMLTLLTGHDAAAHQPRTLSRITAGRVYEQGEVQVPTGETEVVNGIEVPVMATKRGHYVLLMLIGDLSPPEEWLPWLYRWPDDQVWPIEPAGFGEQTAVCQEMAADIDERLAIDATVPVARELTPAQIERREARKAARLAANKPVFDQQRIALRVAAQAKAMNAEIQSRLPAKLAATAARIAANVALRRTLVEQRNAALAIAQDESAAVDDREAARQERDALNERIAAVDGELAADRKWRDGYDELIAERRRVRDAVVVDRDKEQAELASRREARNAEIAALNAAIAAGEM